MKDSKFLLKRAKNILTEEGPIELFCGAIRHLRGKHPFVEVRIRYQYNRLFCQGPIADPFKITSVDPYKMNQTSYKFAAFYHIGVIDGSDWDQNTVPVHHHPKYIAVSQHFLQGIAWEATGLFEYYEKVFDKQDQVDGYRSMEDLKRRYTRIDEIYQDIRDNGFKSPAEASDSSLSQKEKLDYPAIYIGRNGELIFGVGWHRFTISRVLGLNSIPVRVITRHKKWQLKRAKFEKEGIPKEFISHPDLQDLHSANNQ